MEERERQVNKKSLEVLRVARDPMCTRILVGSFVGVEETLIRLRSLGVGRHAEAGRAHLVERLVSEHG